MPRTGRRALLAGLSSVAASAAGCLSSGVPDDSSPAETGSPDPSSTSAPSDRRAPGESARIDGAAVTVDRPRVRKMVVRDSGIWGDVVVGEGQYLLVDVTDAESSLVDDYETVHDLPLAVALDGTRVGSDLQQIAEVTPGAPPIDPERIEDHAVGISIPTRRADDAAVVWTGEDRTVRWDLGVTTREAIARAPAFELRSLETAVLDAGSIELTVTVENTGDRDGQWLGQVSIGSADDISDVFGFDVPAGTSITRSVRPRILGNGTGGFAPGRTVTVEFRSTTRIEREVTIPDESTPTG